MHETMLRLYEAAKAIKGWEGPSNIAQKLNQSPQTLNNWESRGMSKRGMITAQAVIGCSAGWLETGHGEMVFGALPDDQPLSSGTISAASTRKVWVIGQGQGGLPDRVWTDGDYPVDASDEYSEEYTEDEHAFIVKVRGDSMSPRYMPGEHVLVEPSIPPEIEDDVLVRLASGETMIKRLLSRRSGIRLGSWNQAEVMTYAEREITWMYYVSNRVPAHKIKHWVEVSEYEGEDRRHEAVPHTPERRSGAVPLPMSEFEHVYGNKEENDKKDKGEQQ